MIELNKKTQQDFLNREWVQRLLDVGVDMSGAKYYIFSTRCGSAFKTGDNIKVALKEELPWIEGMPGYLPALEYNWCCPTYTVSELLYKLHEWIYPEIDGVKYSGGLKMTKDAPFYPAWYDLKHEVKDAEGNIVRTDKKWDYIMSEAEYPIESLASLLIQCHTHDIGIPMKDVGDISDK